MAPTSPPRHLIFKGMAGFLLGFPLALWVSWLLFYGGLSPGPAVARDQVSMWAVVPLWCAAMGAAFLARSRGQCVAVLGALNAAAAALWWVLQ